MILIIFVVFRLFCAHKFKFFVGCVGGWSTIVYGGWLSYIAHIAKVLCFVSLTMQLRSSRIINEANDIKGDDSVGFSSWFLFNHRFFFWKTPVCKHWQIFFLFKRFSLLCFRGMKQKWEDVGECVSFRFDTVGTRIKYFILNKLSCFFFVVLLFDPGS